MPGRKQPHPNRELWRQIIRDLHGAGFTWTGIGRKLGCGASAARLFANYDPIKIVRKSNVKKGSLAMTYERGRWAIRAHMALCDEHAAHLEPLLAEPPAPSDEAIMRAAER